MYVLHGMQVFPLSALGCFYEDEIEMLLCGAGERWTGQVRRKRRRMCVLGSVGWTVRVKNRRAVDRLPHAHHNPLSNFKVTQNLTRCPMWMLWVTGKRKLGKIWNIVKRTCSGIGSEGG